MAAPRVPPPPLPPFSLLLSLSLSLSNKLFTFPLPLSHLCSSSVIISIIFSTSHCFSTQITDSASLLSPTTPTPPTTHFLTCLPCISVWLLPSHPPLPLFIQLLYSTVFHVCHIHLRSLLSLSLSVSQHCRLFSPNSTISSSSAVSPVISFLSASNNLMELLS